MRSDYGLRAQAMARLPLGRQRWTGNYGLVLQDWLGRTDRWLAGARRSRKARRPTALGRQIWSSKPSKLAQHCVSSAGKISIMITRKFGSSSPVSKVHSCRKIRTFIAKILLRFSGAYADLALWTMHREHPAGVIELCQVVRANLPRDASFTPLARMTSS